MNEWMSPFHSHLFRCRIEEMAPGFVASHNPEQKVVSLCARWACLEESMALLLTLISLLFQSTTPCRYRVYTKFLLTYTAIYRRNRKVLPLGIMSLQPQSHFHLGTPYTYSIMRHIYNPYILYIFYKMLEYFQSCNVTTMTLGDVII